MGSFLALVLMKFLIRLLRAMPVALEKAHLQWALQEMGADHPDAPEVVLRIHTLENLQ